MARALIGPVWGHRALFVALALLLMIVRMLPLSTLPVSVPGPDILVCIACAWVLRRPDYVPVLLIAAVFLLEDFLLMRPPGLWAVIVLVGTEFLRNRVGLMREVGLAMEWALVSVVMFAMVVAYRLVFAAALMQEPPIALVALQLLGSILAYPVVVALSGLLFGLRKTAPGQTDSLGRRI
ncbi:rod shape-determining protein MreD [Solirhodobacter olei]|uniref:rod shape-determining protein MreD n=1 Tax=Solirhodobacter olei TaxID=2493082 RepID=UPI000FDBB985|nr:rod shape-determining protein MreD [Solirhodobacter olei]